MVYKQSQCIVPIDKFNESEVTLWPLVTLFYEGDTTLGFSSVDLRWAQNWTDGKWLHSKSSCIA